MTEVTRRPFNRPKLRDQLADAIRSTVRITVGPRALAELTAGKSIAISGGEADDAALAVLPVVEAATAAKDAEIERLRGLLALAEAAAPATNALARRQRERAEQAEAAVQRVRDLAKAARQATKVPPVDCTNTCYHDACDCSGAWRPVSWDLDPAQILAALDQPEATPPTRCPSCDHLTAMHQPDGCWHTTTTGAPGRDLVCPCSMPRTALDQPEATP